MCLVEADRAKETCATGDHAECARPAGQRELDYIYYFGNTSACLGKIRSGLWDRFSGLRCYVSRSMLACLPAAPPHYFLPSLCVTPSPPP